MLHLREPTLIGDEHHVNKHDFVSQYGISIQATTYLFQSIGSGPDASCEGNIMLVKGNSLNPSSPSQHATDYAYNA